MNEHKSWLRRLLNWADPTPTVRIEAEEENVSFDRQKVDEEFRATIIALRKARKTADAFVVAGELFVKDVRGIKTDGKKTASRAKKP